ncbi:hypothetical protein BKN14_00490 [Candidatus Gracilibacteria bacterium HOT-871]|nr:hypothetical protein BKN14_00490 [Candidatus Gracilibacteria bacterium HOT-871]
MDLKEYAKKVEGLCIDYDGIYGHQCVDLIKHYAQNVLGVKLGSFGGSAKNGWDNTYNTFPASQFEKITDKSRFQVGDIIFWDRGEHGHVAIITKTFGNGAFEVIEQNVGNGDGKGADDCVKLSVYPNYNDVLGVYRFKGKMSQEMEEKLSKAQELGIFNGKDLDKPASRAEVALMCLRIFELMFEKIEK